jgi:hypothetical protein
MDEFVCRNGCGGSYLNKYNRNKHEKISCPVTIKKNIDEQMQYSLQKSKIIEFEKNIELLQKDNNILQNMCSKLEIENIQIKNELIQFKSENTLLKNEILKSKNDHIASLEKTTILTTELAKANNETTQITANVSGKSMSAINCLTRYFTNSPPLQHKEKEIIKSIEYVGTDKHTPEEFMLNRYEHDKLHEWIGDIIINTQTDSENLENQAMWVTDSARYSYIVRQCVEGVSKNEWFADKSGTKVKELIIYPVTKTIDNMMNKYLQTLSRNAIDLYDAKEEAEILSITEKQMLTCSIKKEIKTGLLSNNILKYITPKLNYDQRKIDLFITKQMTKGKNKDIIDKKNKKV